MEERKQPGSIPVGISNFEKIRRENYYYVDKSELLQELLKTNVPEVTLITRPRRFGKTLGMSMLQNFFDIRKESRRLFQGLKVSENQKLCAKWMNQYPVLFLSFKDIDGTSFENAYGMLQFTISQLCIEHAYLSESREIDPAHKEAFERLKMQRGTLTDIKGSLFIIMKMLKKYFGKSVILLLDEYDVPLAKASSHGYYQQMLEVVKAMMSTALKDNNTLKFAVVTGCLKISKESIFTGTNNFVSDTISNNRFNEYFGFTQDEIENMLEEFGQTEKAGVVKEWYDGYHFGAVDVYCPWDVLNYLSDLQHNSDAKPAGYWKNTSDNAIIRSFIEQKGNAITKKLEILLAGGTIEQKIEEELTYDYLHSSEENLWSVLYLTGYLTKAENEIKGDNAGECVALKIPNVEIREIFQSTILKWFDDHVAGWDCKRLQNAVWNGNDVEITAEMSKLLRMTISYHDYKEDYYHAFLAGIFAGAGYVVESNREHGEGRSDVIVLDQRGGRVAVFEVKYSRTPEKMPEDCERALAQINTRMYAKEFEDSYDQVFCYGIAFFKKRCLVKVKEEGQG